MGSPCCAFFLGYQKHFTSIVIVLSVFLQHFMLSHVFWGQRKRWGLICWQSWTVPTGDWPELKSVWLWRRQWPICFAVKWSPCLTGDLHWQWSCRTSGCPHCLDNSCTFIILPASINFQALQLWNSPCQNIVCLSYLHTYTRETFWFFVAWLLWPGLVQAKVLGILCHSAIPLQAT